MPFSRDYQVVTFTARENPERSQMVLLVIERKTNGNSIVGDGYISIVAHALSPDLMRGNDRNFRLGSMGGSYLFIGPALADRRFKVTGGGMELAKPVRDSGLGSYMQGEVIKWLKSTGQNGPVDRIKLSSVHASDQETADLRNRFYRRFGVRFRWQPPINGVKRAEGHSFRKITLADLQVIPPSRRVSATGLLDGLQDFTRTLDSLEADVARLESVQARNMDTIKNLRSKSKQHNKYIAVLGLALLAIFLSALFFIASRN
ncbi:hypothetical protein [Xanthomonas arboricola]|uniref:hypothetical protein n=1 Tax=Xanthomonas arboricola TaxID=56448 RepID=UPI000A9CF4FC|nr:hypothetical protein [Xanthomonas arboricola]